MIHRILQVSLVLALFAMPAVAQDAGQGEQVYVASFKIGYADLGDWITSYQEHDVSVLQGLQESGLIVGWNVWQHNTGGEYNWRFAVRTDNWAAFAKFWQEYLGQTAELAGVGSQRIGRMIQAHYDEIWDITEVNVPEGLTASYLYDARFQIAFPDVDAWNEMWAEHAAPVLNQAMKDGLLGGWVTEGHNTGGRYNWKVLYLFEEWDDIDDVLGRLLGALTSDPEVWNHMGSLIAAHDDVIWEAVPDPDGM